MAPQIDSSDLKLLAIERMCCVDDPDYGWQSFQYCGVMSWFGDPALADAILDRIIHNAHRLQLKGDSLRKPKALTLDVTTQG